MESSRVKNHATSKVVPSGVMSLTKRPLEGLQLAAVAIGQHNHGLWYRGRKTRTIAPMLQDFLKNSKFLTTVKLAMGVPSSHPLPASLFLGLF